jgi:hypothetical protein
MLGTAKTMRAFKICTLLVIYEGKSDSIHKMSISFLAIGPTA